MRSNISYPASLYGLHANASGNQMNREIPANVAFLIGVGFGALIFFFLRYAMVSMLGTYCG